MGTYKVIQDIEAEDHILGPLTLRQFIYGLVAAFCLYISFLCIVKGVPFLLIVFLPPGLFAAFFAVPFGQDQPTEVWALAKIRFLFKPRKRIWNQSGVKQLVTITVPKKIERALTDGLSQGEVKSRLQALGETLDSRGWAVKNINVNLYGQPNTLLIQPDSDRLVDAASLPQEVPSYDIQASDDMLDERNNLVAHQFDQLINATSQAHREDLLKQMAAPASTDTTPPAQPNWFMPAATDSRQPALPVSNPVSDMPDEAALTAELKARRSLSPTFAHDDHIKTIQPLGQGTDASAVATAASTDQATGTSDQQTDMTATPDTATPAITTSTTSPAKPDPAILNLASNNDLNVATLARQAQKAKGDELSEGEVVISLH